MRRYGFFISVLLSMAFSQNAQATETGWRRIYEISCGIGSPVCGVKVTGLAAGPEDCKSNVLRWKTDDVGGAETLLLVITAFYTDRYVNFTLDEECFALQKNLPSIHSVKTIK